MRPNYTLMSVNVPSHRARHLAKPWVRHALVLALVVVATLLALAPPAGAIPAQHRTAVTPQPEVAVLERVDGLGASFSGPATSANARFIAAMYDELLGREADTGGLDFHLARLTAGGDRTRHVFTRALLFSAEGSRREVHRAYDDLLGRAPDSAGEGYWTTHLQSHGVSDLRVLLLASDEFWTNAGGTTDAWLEAVYQKALGRSIDEPGRLYWTSQLDGGVPRILVAAAINLSDEALGRRVDRYYDESLHRSPAAAARSGAVAIIRAEGERGLRARLWASDEVFERHLEAASS